MSGRTRVKKKKKKKKEMKWKILKGVRASDRVVIEDGIQNVWVEDCEIPSIGAMNLPVSVEELNFICCEVGTLEGVGRLGELKEIRLGCCKLDEIVEIERLDKLRILELCYGYTGTLEGLVFPENMDCLYININPFRNCLENCEGVYYNPRQELRIYTVMEPVANEADLEDVCWSTTYKCPEIRNGTKRTCTKALFKTKEHPYSLQAWCVRTSYLLGGVTWQDVDSALYKNESLSGLKQGGLENGVHA